MAWPMQLIGLEANVYIHKFEREDIVRSGLVRDIMDRYELT